jgi:hypothetical protein
MAYELIWKDDEFVQGRNKQYILYHFGINDIKKITIKESSNLRDTLIAFRLPKCKTTYRCSLETYIQIKQNQYNRSLDVYLSSVKGDIKYLKKYLKSNIFEIKFNIKYPLFYKINYIINEFNEIYSLNNIDKNIKIKYFCQVTNKRITTTFGKFIENNKNMFFRFV